MFSNTQLKTAGSGLMLVLVVVGLLVGATGGAIAQEGTATPTATDSGSGVELVNSTVSVDNDTRSVYADVAAGNSSVDLTVTFAGVDADGNETELEERSVTVNASEEQLVERSDVNTSAYESYRVMVTAPNLNSTEATAEVGKVAEVAGGGGGFGIGGGAGSIGTVGIVVVVAGALLVLRRDD
ncbi:hypothetical protein B4589_009525 [Halolamina sp. CBA1230]|uniref:hypothetical protein n=1 Tax=Halolamina sp. CBA1230 TaxID=1853690 RepID=UPI00117A3694|nr:hypothetical protein [Halolamina sp. CBA1230]QKY20605.1 hypothetical protein B4589_009525 [Halolamina sp. CBA1230]